MDETIFPPSVNWFQPKNLTCRDDGSLAYGAKNALVILKTDAGKNVSTQIIENAHELRITAVSFSPGNSCKSICNTVVTCSDDGYVKAWNIEDLTPLIGHKSHWESKEKVGKVICLDWSNANPELIVSAGENNTLVLWNVTNNSTTRFCLPRLQPTVIAFRPDDGKVVAVGSKSGLVYVLSLTEGGKILSKLRGHDDEVQSLCWCPKDGSVFQNSMERERLLASASKDKEIYVWRAGTDGRCETTIKLPAGPLPDTNRDKGRYKGSVASNFVALYWAEPSTIFSNTSYGELISCDVESLVKDLPTANEASNKQAKLKSKNLWKLIHDFHSRSIFAICGFKEGYSTECNGTSPGFAGNHAGCDEAAEGGDHRVNSPDKINPKEFSILLWTAASDQKIVLWKVARENSTWVYNLHTMNGFAYCASPSPHDPNRIAIACGDGVVRLWNLTEPSGDLQIYWQKIKDKVMSLAWHPVKDGLLAYGTSEGRVGLIDTHSNKPPVLFKPAHLRSVYWLSWGPSFQESEESRGRDASDFALYSVGNNIISQYDPSKPNSASINISNIVDFPCKKQTDISWKPDHSLVAVGNEDGSICLLSPPRLEIIAVVQAYQKTIQSIAWHPVSTILDSGVSPYRGYFACGTTDKSNEIRVFNCVNKEKETVIERVAALKGHKEYIQHVSWSPQIGGRLVSSSADSSIHIWDVVRQAALVVYVPFPGQMPLFSIWSPIDPDIIISGCRNKTLCVWRISTKSKSEVPNPVKYKKGKKKILQPEKILSAELSTDWRKTKDERSDNVPEDPKLTEGDIPLAKVKTVGKQTKEPKMFSKAWKGEPDDPEHCYSLLKKDSVNSSDFHLKFLGSRDDWMELVTSEEDNKKRSNSWSECYGISLWRGNLKEVVEERMKSGELDDYLVSLTPMVSPRLWLEACASYSKSLAESKQFRKAAGYLIACHKIEEAIDLLISADLYLEALCIGRCRLNQDDAKIREILKSYAGWLSKNGSFSKACECLIYLGDYVEAAKIMARRNEAEYQAVAALASKKGGSESSAAAYAASAIIKCLENGNLELAVRICADHPDLKSINLLYHMYDTIRKKEEDNLQLEKNILDHVRVLARFQPGDDSYRNLDYCYDKNTFYHDKRKMLVAVVRELSLACCHSETDAVLTHVLRALSACHRYFPKKEENAVPMLFQMCALLAPKGLEPDAGLFSLDDPSVSQKVKSLRAFYCQAVMELLDRSLDESLSSERLKIVKSLQADLFDLESVKYFKNQMEIKVYEKKVTESRLKKDVGQSEEEKVEASAPLTDDLQILNRLITEVENFESSRVVCPNPVLSYCKLRNICQRFSTCLTAKTILRETEESSFARFITSATD